MRLSVARIDGGAEVRGATTVAYDLELGVASSAGGLVVGSAVVWRLEEGAGDGVLLARTVDLDRSLEWIVRCDRVEFPLGGIAHRHVHPGPGIRYLLRGEIEIDTGGTRTTYVEGQAWFESGPEPVVARASDELETAFVRLLLLPAHWAGRRTIRYLETVDEAAPKQTASVLLEQPIVLPA